jgi:hypothetical protein
MAISEKDYTKIIEDLTYLAETGADEYLDSLAVAYVVMLKLGDRNAESWLMEMKEHGIPIEWESLRDGKQRGFSDIEKMIKNLIGIYVFKNGKLSLRERLYRRKVKSKLRDMIWKAEELKRSIHIINAYVLASLYTLTGDSDMEGCLIIGDDAYKKLPIYVQWIEKYMWG